MRGDTVVKTQITESSFQQPTIIFVVLSYMRSLQTTRSYEHSALCRVRRAF